MFRVFLTNFGYYSHREFDTLGQALDFAKRCGFETTIHKEHSSELIASYSPLGGTHVYLEEASK